MELERKITKSDNKSKVRLSKIRLIFNDQKLLDLWNNELSGQLSDGAWENSSGAEWLWKNYSSVLGKENKVFISDPYIVKRKNFPFFKELFDIVGDRMLIENGFENEKELKKACKIIQDMIKNHSYDEKISKEIIIQQNTIKLKKEKRIKSFLERLNGYEFKKEYDWSNYLININNFRIEILSVSIDNIIKIEVYGKEFSYSKFKMYIEENDFDEIVKTIVKLTSFYYTGDNKKYD